MDYETIAQEVALIVKQMYRTNKDFADVLYTVESAIKKYDTTIDKVSLKLADVDHKKLIWQILVDLRFARGTDYEYDIEMYRCDTSALQNISSYLEEKTTEFNREGSTVVDISAINREEYFELIKMYDLK